MNKELESYLSHNLEQMEVDSAEFVELLRILASKLNQHRNENKGRLPKEAWLAILKIFGISLYCDILLTDHKGIPLLAIRHDPTAVGKEAEWEGKLHVPGLAIYPALKAEQILPYLIRKEVTGDRGYAQELVSQAKLVGIRFIPEPERETMAFGTVFTVAVDPQRIKDGFEPITQSNLPNVIKEHLVVLNWFQQKNRPVFFGI